MAKKENALKAWHAQKFPLYSPRLLYVSLPLLLLPAEHEPFFETFE
jgi:hypothetical protein